MSDRYWLGYKVLFQPLSKKEHQVRVSMCLPLEKVREEYLDPTADSTITNVVVCGGTRRRSGLHHFLTPSKPDFYFVMIRTSDGFWWKFINDPGVTPSHDYDWLPRIEQYTEPEYASGSYVSVKSSTIREDESNVTVRQFVQFLQDKYQSKIQFTSNPGDTLLFSKEVFLKLAKIKSWERLQGILQSPGSHKTGSGWEGVIRYLEFDITGISWKFDYDSERIVDLIERVDPIGNQKISHVAVYKIPSSEQQYAHVFFYHSYIVFRTVLNRPNRQPVWTWWSIEKNGMILILQRGTSETDVRDKMDGEKRYEPRFYWQPQLVMEDTSTVSVKYLLEFIRDNEELDIRYHGTTENCQMFSKVMFNKLARNKKWEKSPVLKTVTDTNRRVAGLRDPRSCSSCKRTSRKTKHRTVVADELDTELSFLEYS